MREGDSVSDPKGSHHPCWVQTISYSGCFKVTSTPAPKSFILLSKSTKSIGSSVVNFGGICLWLGF